MPHPIRQRILQLLHEADVWPDGSRDDGDAKPWDPRIHDEQFHARVLAQGTLGLGESYMDAQWDVDDLDGMLERLILIDAEDRVRGFGAAVDAIRARLVNLQTEARSFEVGKRHYDLGKRPVSRHARQTAGVQLRLLAQCRRSRRRAGSQARSRLP